MWFVVEGTVRFVRRYHNEGFRYCYRYSYWPSLCISRNGYADVIGHVLQSRAFKTNQCPRSFINKTARRQNTLTGDGMDGVNAC